MLINQLTLYSSMAKKCEGREFELCLEQVMLAASSSNETRVM